MLTHLPVAIVRPIWAVLSDPTNVTSARKASCTQRTLRDIRRSTSHSHQLRIRFTAKSVVATTSKGFLVATTYFGTSASNIPPWWQSRSLPECRRTANMCTPDFDSANNPPDLAWLRHAALSCTPYCLALDQTTIPHTL
jgi:hypothetical protein